MAVGQFELEPVRAQPAIPDPAGMFQPCFPQLFVDRWRPERLLRGVVSFINNSFVNNSFTMKLDMNINGEGRGWHHEQRGEE